MLKGLADDVRFAVRSFFIRDATLAIVCVLTLGIGIGATTAVFTVVNGVLLEPFPYPRSDRLFQLFQTTPRRPGELDPFLTAPVFEASREQMTSFDQLAALYTYSPEGFDLESPDGPPRRLTRLKVSSGYFETLGIGARLGRTFLREEELMAGPIDPDRPASYEPSRPLAILSHRLWQSALGGDPGAAGRQIRLSGELYTVIGVMPEGFRDPLVSDVDVWVPHNLSPGGYNNRWNSYLTIVGRLAPGAEWAVAQAELDTLLAAMQQDVAAGNRRGARIQPMREVLVGGIRPLLWLLLAAAGGVLLVACLNVLNLFLLKGLARRKELAVRAALGAGRGRIGRQLLTESLAVAAVGGGLGWLLGEMGWRALVALQPQGLPAVATVRFDAGLFAFTLGLILMTALVAGLVPALQNSRVDLETALREGGRGEGAAGSARLRTVLVLAQVSLLVVLLVGTGLTSRSFAGLLQKDLGFRPGPALTWRVDLPATRYSDPAMRVRFYEELTSRLHALPGLRASGFISKLPVTGPYHGRGFQISGRDPESPLGRGLAQMRVVGGRYFEAAGTPLVRGRLFSAADRPGSEPVVIVSRGLAETYFEGADPVGERLQFAGAERTIVGVVADTLFTSTAPAAHLVYLPHPHYAANRIWRLWHVSDGGDREGLLEAIRNEVADIDSQLSVFDVDRLDAIAARALSRQRFGALLMALFSVVALGLVAVGLHGVLAHFVRVRRREIGVRMALGAVSSQVRRLVWSQAVKVVCGGLALGLVASLMAGRWLEATLHEVSPFDPAVYLTVVAFVALTAVVVAWTPARRASRVNALRSLLDS